MSIRVKIDLEPFGRSRHVGLRALADFHIWSDPSGSWHHYSILLQGQTDYIDGKVKKTKSGHRNILHLLRDIIKDVDLKSLGTDYVTTDLDQREDLNERQREELEQ